MLLFDAVSSIIGHFWAEILIPYLFPTPFADTLPFPIFRHEGAAATLKLPGRETRKQHRRAAPSVIERPRPGK
jgi:hypothetical protein